MEAPGARTAARKFGATASDVRVTRNTTGHIHETWLVEGSGAAFVLQQLNVRVFPDCVRMMDNILRVTAHLGSQVRDPERRVLCPLRAEDGAVLVQDVGARPWRAFVLVPGASSCDVVDNAHVAHEVARALGRFVVSVQDLPGPPLVAPIPNFKDFARRRDDFELMVDLDPYGRAASCRTEIEGIRRRHHLVTELSDDIEAGDLPERVVHNDAKANNVLLDDASGEGLCVVDLDTVGPGVVLFDIGDLLRSATVTSTEDASDLVALAVRDDLLEAALSGYLGEAAPMLTDGERERIPLAGPLMAYENALRFLTDHLEGDVYYRVARPRHNLDRARAQLRVVEALTSARARVAELVLRA